MMKNINELNNFSMPFLWVGQGFGRKKKKKMAMMMMMMKKKHSTSYP